MKYIQLVITNQVVVPWKLILRCFQKMIFTLFSLSVIGCATTEVAWSEKAETAIWSEVERDPNYLYSEIEVVYDAVLEGMTEGYFRDFPDLDAMHTEAMVAFILEENSKEVFVTMMVRDESIEIFKKAKGNKAYWDTKEFQDAFNLAINVSVPIARMIVGNTMDLYIAKFVDKDPIKTELFEMATDENTKQYIAWVYGEVTREEYEKDEFAQEYSFEDGDRIFGFSGGDWENLTGRQGYIIVRGGKIHESFITIMN